MKYLLALIATAVIAKINPQFAAAFWAISIAVEHAAQETKGRLWVYFGEITGLKALTRVNPVVGVTLIVAPALALQTISAVLAFALVPVNVFWLALLIGARLGDALFSHALPLALGAKAQADLDGQVTQRNPGLSSALIYALDGVLFLLIWQDALLNPAVSTSVIAGAALGAGFFAAVQPSLRLIAHLLPTLSK